MLSRNVKRAVVLISSICMIGCSNRQAVVSDSNQDVYSNQGTDNRQNEEEISKVILDEVVEEDTEDETIVEDIEFDITADEDTLLECQEEQPYQFRFVDVFGEEYETEIKVDFPKSEYQNDKFRFEDDRTVYDDVVYYTRQGIDVSNYQGIVDWDKVKASGIDFAIIRIGYRGYGKSGSLNVDKEFRRNIENAKAAGLDVGVYFFAQAVNEEEAIEEARFVLSNLEGYELELPIVYDPESILDVPARTDNVTAEQFTKNTVAFCEAVKAAGYEPMIYANMLWQAFELDMELLNEYQFWYADYEQLPQTPYKYTIWQYSNTGHVDGVKGEVDLDIEFIKK